MRKLRNLMGLTQKELSKKAGFSLTNSASEIRIRQIRKNMIYGEVDFLMLRKSINKLIHKNYGRSL